MPSVVLTEPEHHFIVSNWTAVDIGVYNTVDSVVMAFYLLLVLIVGLVAVLFRRRATIGDFFLASRNLTWFPIGASLYATNISSGHFMGLPWKGAASGIAIGTFQWISVIQLCVLGWVILPVYIKAEVVTLPEYLRKRFGSFRIQILISVLYLFLYVFNRISLEICHSAMFLRMILGMDVYLAILVLLAIASIYTITGGLAAVTFANCLHASIMVVGLFLLMCYAFVAVGGYQELLNKYFDAIPSVISDGNWTATPECYLPRPDAFHIFRDPVSGDIPWPGLLFGVSSLTFYFWSADQVFVQLCLAGKNLSHVRGGCLVCGYLKLVLLFCLVMPGMISRILFPDKVACVVPSECQKFCGASTNCKPIAYPMLVIKLLPSGLRGLLLSSVCASFMSSLTSVFNSASALFTLNIYAHMRPMATEKELMITGRFFVIILFAVTIVWVPIMNTLQSETLYEYKQAVRSYLTPPITAIFLLAIFCKRVNEKGAFWGLILGTVMGFSRLLVDFIFSQPWSCMQKSRCPAFLCGVHYLYFNLILLAISLLSMLVISLATDPIPDKHLHRLCWSLRNSQEERVDLKVEMRWKRLSKSPPQPEMFKEGHSCIWRTWTLFCGLDPQPGPKLAPEKVKEEAVQQRDLSLEGAEGLAPGEAARRSEDAKGGGRWPKSLVKWVLNGLLFSLITLVVAGFIYYA
ncbi:sodium/glucose cotransporter 1 isoform X1 [Oryctolagus cuniculus]|uniref:sodium/glucose cotransporter 1 isoform X1 n=1 Tax=Oryctolagus cuniculus TaxID=9986 RepID=UPI0038796280